MASPLPSELATQRLGQLRPALMTLHKTLMEAERANYEALNGPIANRGEYLQLVLGHENFSWLRPISQFIVEVDELLLSKRPQPPERADELFAAARDLLLTSTTATTIEQRIATAARFDPTLTPLQAKITDLLTNA